MIQQRLEEVDSYIQWTECNGIPRGEIIREYIEIPLTYCTFTGQRQCSRKQADIHIRALLTEVIREQVPDVFLIGMGAGADLLAAQILSEWNIPWEAVMPFEGHYGKWNMSDRRLLDELLSCAESTTYVRQEYSRMAYAMRNRYMIEKSQLCCAYWNGDLKGGTAMTVKLARKKNIDVIQYHPKYGLITPESYQYNLFDECF